MKPKGTLKRLDTVYRDDVIYFVTACTAGRGCFLDNQQIHNSFVTFCRVAATRNILVGRYVLMPDHLHLFVQFPFVDEFGATANARTAQPLPGWLKSLKNSLSKTLRETDIPAPHWQKNYFDHVLRSNESYAEKWDYVRANPVRAKLVAQACDWPWSGEINELRW